MIVESRAARAPRALVQERVANSTAPPGLGGVGSYEKRALSSIRYDDIGISLASNVITIPAGTYRARIGATGISSGAHQARLRDTTSSATVVVAGCQENLPDSFAKDIATNESAGEDEFTVTVSTNLELQHRFQNTGFGGKQNPANFVEENIFSWVHLEKIA